MAGRTVGKTPLWYAKAAKHEEIARLLSSEIEPPALENGSGRYKLKNFLTGLDSDLTLDVAKMSNWECNPVEMISTRGLRGWVIISEGHRLYRIYSTWPRRPLGVYLSAGKVRPFIAQTENSRRSWKITSCGDSTFGLSIDYQGRQLHLDLDKDKMEVFLSAGESSGQHWYLTPLMRS